jgi:IMP dehydrogenase
MCKTVSWFGGFGIVHRYNSIEAQASIVREAAEDPEFPAAAAVGVSDDLLPRATALVSAGAFLLCIDVAHGHHTNVERAIKTLKDKFGEGISIMAGNVATAEAFIDLEEWGSDVVRVGVGGGSICSTRIETGHGVPTLHSVIDCARVANRAMIVADGGIKNAGDIVKSLAAGADFVMLGSLLAGTDESPGQVIENTDGEKRKVYRGMASPEAQMAWRGRTSSLEGISTTVPYKGSVQDTLSLLSQNIKSGLSYSGARSLKEFRSKAKMIKQTPAGINESYTHILKR